MDPISITASIVGLVETARSVTRALYEFQRASKAVSQVFLEIDVYTDILQEVSEYPLLTSQTMPRAAESSIRLCYNQLLALQTFTNANKWRKDKLLGTRDIEKAVHGFITSVQILRDVVMEYEHYLRSLDVI